MLAAAAANPSFLALHPNHRFLYAVGETSAASNGVVNAFAIDSTTGTLALLNQQTSAGRGPCHLAVDKTGTCALVANYGSGSVALLPIHNDGSLGPPTTSMQHQGASIDPKRQQGPHAHGVGFDLINHRAFCADLGLDKILIYQYDQSKATITPNDPPSGSVKPGAGVRHFAFHPNGRACTPSMNAIHRHGMRL